jgi:hypothetical protein
MIKSITRSVSSTRAMLMAGAAAVLSVAALGFSSGAHARSDVNFSVGVSVPGVVVGVSNAYPVYTAPVYGYQQPVYGYQPQPVYVQPRPVYRPYYVQAPVYVAPPPVYYRGGHHHRHHGHGHRGHGHHRGHGGHGGHHR